MPSFDIEKRNFLKSIMMAFVMAFFIEFGGIQKLVFGQGVQINDNLGILYSTATGIVLRTINPPTPEQGHLTWLQNNLPNGTALLLLNKQAIGADDNNAPNMDFIIPYAKQNNGITLSYGVPCSVIKNNIVTDTVLCCPTLYGKVVTANAIQGLSLIQKPANIGDIYNPALGTFTAPTKGTIV